MRESLNTLPGFLREPLITAKQFFFGNPNPKLREWIEAANPGEKLEVKRGELPPGVEKPSGRNASYERMMVFYEDLRMAEEQPIYFWIIRTINSIRKRTGNIFDKNHSNK